MNVTCFDVSHQRCQHPGWQQIDPHVLGLPLIGAARRGADIASTRLGLEQVRLLFFEPGPTVHTSADGIAPIDYLNILPYDPSLRGYFCHPDLVRPLTIWLNASLSALAVQWVASHEIRHLWQARQGSEGDGEADADAFAWCLVAKRLTPMEIQCLAAELNFFMPT